MIQITALMENEAGRENLACEHGLSLLVEYRGKRVLLDCGQSGLFLENARALGISLEGLDAVVLSHSHYDHALGYRELVKEDLAGGVLYTGPGFFEGKYSMKDDQVIDRGCGFCREFLEEKGIAHREVEGTIEILPGMWLVSGFPRETDHETIPHKFLRMTGAGLVPDDFRDEICAVLEGEDGLVMLVGCSHPGIVNMVMETARRLGKPVTAVFGGTHLLESEGSRIHKTLEGLHRVGVKRLAFSHCSGEAAAALTAKDGRFRCEELHCGQSVMLQEIDC